MVVVRIKGGLGNQLFQYASAYALAKRLNQSLKIDSSFFSNQTLRSYKLQLLNIKFLENIDKLPLGVQLLKNKYLNKVMRKLHITIPIRKPLYLLENRSKIVKQFFTITSNDVYVDGYYQSEKYFKEYRNELVSQFTPKYRLNSEYLSALKKINDCNSVAIHVRRGDFLKAQYNSYQNHYLLGKEYYYNSLLYMNKKLNKPYFYWFSDDVPWVVSQFGTRENFIYISMHTKNQDIDEFMLMKSCKNIITANSTFSWWAAWLNENSNAIRVCPAKIYGNIEMIPNEWIKIDIK